MNYIAEIIKALLELALTPGGQAAAEKLLVEKGLTLADLHAAIAALKDPPDPKA